MDKNLNCFINKVDETVRKTRKLNKINKINEIEFEIPKFNEYCSFINKNYRMSFLKDICKEYKLKLSGNKPDLIDRIYKHLYNSNYAVIIQKNLRRYFVNIYFKLIGPAIFNRSLCMNSTDFFTLENIADIQHTDFFSYRGSDNSIWGFNVISIYNLFTKSGTEILNPYTREKMKANLFNKIKHLVRLSKVLNNPVNVIINNNHTISPQKKLELKCLDLFQYIDELGNYTDVRWFTTLTRVQLVQFIRDLVDIWEYRAQLNNNVKKEICHPYGNPFRYVDITQISYLNYIVSFHQDTFTTLDKFHSANVYLSGCCK